MKKIILVLTSFFIFLITRLFHLSYRYRFFNNEVLQKLKRENKNFIFAIWHQNLFAGILAQTGLRHIVIVSKSNDAAPVAFTCEQLGHLVVRGSSRKGNVDKNGQAAKSEMIECLLAGHPGAVTVDGPKGPALKVKPGIIDMAIKAQVVIVPYLITPKCYWQFKSWDKFRLPKPFSKIVVSYGEPIKVGENGPHYENDLVKLEEALNLLTLKSDEQIKNWDKFSHLNWWEEMDKLN